MKRGNNPETATAFVHYEEMNGSNFYSYADICKSYNTVIASHQTGKYNTPVILLNSCDYSNTTQRHKLHIRRAARKTTLFEVPICYRWNGLTKDEHRTNLEYLQARTEEARQKARKARKYTELWTEETGRRQAEADIYKAIFEL